MLNKTLNPVWNFDCALRITSLSGDITIEVGDSDDVGSNDFLGLIKLKISDVAHRGICGGWYHLKDKKGEERAHGRIFIVLVVDRTLKEGKERSEAERSSMLFYATKQLVHEMDNSPDEIHTDPSAAIAALSLSPTSASNPAQFFALGSSAAPAASDAPLLPVQSRLSLFIGTWNVGNAPPSEDLRSWLRPNHDLYAIGVQECNYDAPSRLTTCAAHFQEVLETNLGKDYALVKKSELMQIRHFIYARKTLLSRIDGITAAVEGTGLGGVVGNKGGVALHLRIDDSSVVFVTCHLAAHQDRSSRRNKDVADILAGIRLNRRNLDMMHSARYCFWSGDLNYRLNYGTQGKEHSPTQQQFDTIVSKIQSGKREEIEELFASDQLVAARKNGEVFLPEFGWTEGDNVATSSFQPTFKVARETGTHYMNQRSPAWCDRILWRVGMLPASQIDLAAQFAPVQRGLGSSPDIASSDHKPVWASFDVPLLRIPLATDFTRGELSIRFSRVALKGLAFLSAPSVTGAERAFLSPLLKFHSTMLLMNRETKQKAPSGAAATTAAAGTSPNGSTVAASAAAAAVAVATSNPPVAASSTAATVSWEGSELPLLQSLVNNPARLRTQPLLIKVLASAGASPIERLLALASIDLSVGFAGQLCEFSVPLLQAGLPVGQATGAFQLEWAPLKSPVPAHTTVEVKAL